MSESLEQLLPTNDEEVHLVLFIHGLWGNPKHMRTIEKALKRSLKPVSSERIVSIKPSSFRFWKTYDGIQRCAENVIKDLLYEIETLKQSNKCKVTKISIIGYSLGGLISRYTIGRLYELGFFEEVVPVFFCTFATPHAGVHFFKNNLFDISANSLGKCLFGKTGFELFVADSDKLLLEMSQPNSVYIKGLKLFQIRTLMANIKNDRSVPFYTSYITPYSPFDHLNFIHIKYFEDLPSANVGKYTVWPKFVDLKNSYKIPDGSEKYLNKQEATSILRSNLFIRYSILLVAALILFPFYIPLVIWLSLYVSLYSILKIKVSKSPEITQHWQDVKRAVYHGGVIDAEHTEQGERRREDRLHLARHESFKGDTSSLTGRAMERMLAAEQNFVDGHNEMIEEGSENPNVHAAFDREPDSGELNSADDEDQSPDLSEQEFSSDSELTYGSTLGKSGSRNKKSLISTLLKPQTPIEIQVEENDKAAERVIEDLRWDKNQKVPLFNEDTKLSLPKAVDQIITNLNELDWIKIPVYHDSFNAHDSVVARRGIAANPKGTCTLFFWGSLLKRHILQTQNSNDST